jgi:hypothetical protein
LRLKSLNPNGPLRRWRGHQERRPEVTDHKKKGDFDQSRKHDVGGNKKQDNSDNTNSRTGNQNAGHGGRR